MYKYYYPIKDPSPLNILVAHVGSQTTTIFLLKDNVKNKLKQQYPNKIAVIELKKHGFKLAAKTKTIEEFKLNYPELCI